MKLKNEYIVCTGPSLELQSILTTLLTQQHRCYHNIKHINDCLAELEQFIQTDGDYTEQQLYQFNVVGEWAIWFHDAVYNPYSKLNELRSAYLFKQYRGTAITHVNVDLIDAAILATRFHTDNQKLLPDAVQLMLDIDLCGLGKPFYVFAQNSLDIAKEYYDSTAKEIVEGRLKFFEALNKRDSFYYLPYFQNKYGQQAKENIAQEIEWLTIATETKEYHRYFSFLSDFVLKRFK